MKAIKWFLQVLCATVYTLLFITAFYYIIVYPLAWFVTLKWWQMMLFFVFGTAILESITSFLLTWLMVPYMWIVKRNSMAMWISIIGGIIGIGDTVYYIWAAMLGHGVFPIILAVVYSIVLVQLVFATCSILYSYKTESYLNE